MSVSAECWLGSFYVGSTKNDFDPTILCYFQSNEKNIVRGTTEFVPYQMRRWMRWAKEENEEIEVVFYEIPINILRDRFNLKGYTLEVAKEYFNLSVLERIDFLKKSGLSDRYPKIIKSEIELLSQFTADTWIKELAEIHNRINVPQKPIKYQDRLISMKHYMLEHQDNWYGYPGVDMGIALRLAIEALPDSETLIYDLTDLIGEDFYSSNADFVSISEFHYASEYYYTGKIIVLTEGSTDSKILSDSLSLLYPHLYDSFTFLDFNEVRIGGGVGNLANIVKAFSGSGIINRIIALFDNDTASYAAMSQLYNLPIPKNIRILNLPALDFLKSYPTIGPSGPDNLDINGLAASIELYLGKDTLIQNGSFFPVQWKGYNDKLKRYQGEITNKAEIQHRFEKRILQCKKDSSKISNYDWTGINKIFQMLFSAFHENDANNILNK